MFTVKYTKCKWSHAVDRALRIELKITVLVLVTLPIALGSGPLTSLRQKTGTGPLVPPWRASGLAVTRCDGFSLGVTASYWAPYRSRAHPRPRDVLEHRSRAHIPGSAAAVRASGSYKVDRGCSIS